MDKKINNAVFELETIAKLFEKEGYLTKKQTDTVYNKLRDVRLTMLTADKKYDLMEARKKMGLEPKEAYA